MNCTSFSSFTSYSLPESFTSNIKAQNIPLEIIFEDEYLAVINKPAGLVVHPGHGNPDQTLVNAIAYRFGGDYLTKKCSKRPGIVHRLDKDTSGLVLIAKDERTQSLLANMFAKREVKKIYLVITSGIPKNSSGKIENKISRDKNNPIKMSVNDNGKLALSYFKIIRYYNGFAFLEISIESGRTHQIRVQMDNMNNPVLGDKLYNSIKRVQTIVPDNMKKMVYDLLTNHLHRQALHAWKISFSHPYTNEELTFTAPIPKDFFYTLDWLEKFFAIDSVGYDKNMLMQ